MRKPIKDFVESLNLINEKEYANLSSRAAIIKLKEEGISIPQEVIEQDNAIKAAERSHDNLIKIMSQFDT